MLFCKRNLAAIASALVMLAPCANGQDTKPAQQPATRYQQAATSPTATAIEKVRIWKEMEIAGEVLDDAPPFALFTPPPSTIRKFREQLEQAANEKNVEGVLLHIKSPQMSLATIEELRSEIERFRSRGKKIYAYLSEGDQAGYILATGCDRICMTPAATLILTGLRLEGLFFKNLLDRIGVEAQLISIGKYKDAGEPLTRAGWSQPAREAMDALADDLFDQMAALIADGRNLPYETVRQLIDEGPYTANEALKHRLVDELSYQNDLTASLRGQNHGTIRIESMEDEETHAQPIQPFDLLGMLMGKKSAAKPLRGDTIAVIFATGPILSETPDGALFPQPIITPDEITEILEECLEDETIKAVVLRIDSPGGDATASDIIWRQIRRVAGAKPVVASMSNVAASGGYYIAMGANHIIAQPASITGSIGVLGGKVVMNALLQKINVNTELVTRGKNAGLLSSATPFSETERAAMQRILVGIYEDFITKVAISRGIPAMDVEEVAQGRVWSGRQALEAGLVDDLGGLDKAIQTARELAGIAPDWKVDILTYPEEMTFQQVLEKIFSGGASLASPLNDPAVQALLPDGIVRHTSLLHLFDSPKPLMLMPFLLSVR